ncbi:MAG: hypothetical protein WC002_03415 [Candidatus Muiribacteriota bacterium]
MTINPYTLSDGVLNASQVVSGKTMTMTIYILSQTGNVYDALFVEKTDGKITDVEMQYLELLPDFALYSGLISENLNDKAFVVDEFSDPKEYVNFYSDGTFYNSMDDISGSWSLVSYTGKNIIRLLLENGELEFILAQSSSNFDLGESVTVSILHDVKDGLMDDSHNIEVTVGNLMSDFNGGAGTIANPYQVATAAQLNKVRNHLDKHFIQTEDIDLSGYATGDVAGLMNVGGLVGTNGIDVITMNCYATGNVHAIDPGGINAEPYPAKVGGFAGFNYSNAKILNSYSTGVVTTDEENNVPYGFVGYNDTSEGAEVSGCYWDTTTSGDTEGMGINTEGATGKTTAEMKTQGTFTGWDFTTIWQINAGEYPTLR